MDQNEYDEVIKQFEYAANQMDNALHYLYECGSCLRHTGTDEGDLLDAMIDGAKMQVEHWCDVIKGTKESWASEHYDKAWEADE